MNENVKKIITKIMKATSLEEIDDIVSEVEKRLDNASILTEDALLVMRHLTLLRKDLGLIPRRRVQLDYKPSMKEIKNLISSLNITPANMEGRSPNPKYGVFFRDNTFTVGVYRYNKYLNTKTICEFIEDRLLDGNKPHYDYLSENADKIIEIMGMEAYIVPDYELFGTRMNFRNDQYPILEKRVNEYLKSHPDFIEDLFSYMYMQEKQKEKVLKQNY